MSVEELVVLNAGWLRTKARRYYRDAEDAEDLAGETIYKILRQMKRFDSERAFRPWALAIMQNTYITQYNRRKCVLFTTLDGCEPEGPEWADQSARVGAVMNVARRCSERSRNIESVMLYAEGYDHSEISQILGIPVGTVKSRISLGRKMLRKSLGI